MKNNDLQNNTTADNQQQGEPDDRLRDLEVNSEVMGGSASPMPVLLVIADQQDFYQRGNNVTSLRN